MNYTRVKSRWWKVLYSVNILKKTWILESIISYWSNVDTIQNSYFFEMKQKILGTLLAMKLDTEKKWNQTWNTTPCSSFSKCIIECLPFFNEQSAVIKSLLHMHVPLLQLPFPLHSFGQRLLPISWGGAIIPFSSFSSKYVFLEVFFPRSHATWSLLPIELVHYIHLKPNQ